MISENPCWRGKVSDHCSIRTCHLWRAVDAGVVIWSFKNALVSHGLRLHLASKEHLRVPISLLQDCRKVRGSNSGDKEYWSASHISQMLTGDSSTCDGNLLQHLAPTPWGGAAGFWPSLFCMPSNSKGSLKVAKSHQESSNVMRTPLVCLL